MELHRGDLVIIKTDENKEVKLIYIDRINTNKGLLGILFHTENKSVLSYNQGLHAEILEGSMLGISPLYNQLMMEYGKVIKVIPSSQYDLSLTERSIE